MRKFTLLESALIGFFVGVIVATYSVFVTSTGGYVGHILGSISWVSIQKVLTFSGDTLLVIPFLFTVCVYTVYGMLLSLLINSRKILIYAGSIAAVILIGIFIEQIHLSKLPKNVVVDMPLSNAVMNSGTGALEQYFGREVKGDLNGDHMDDVAFIIVRNDADRGMLYYLVASIRTAKGYEGTNLIFLGDKVEPQVIRIGNEIITVEYRPISSSSTSTLKAFHAKVSGGNLEEVKM